MIGQVYDGLVGYPGQLRLVLDAQHRHLVPCDGLCARRVDDRRFHRTGEPLATILAPQAELVRLSSLEAVHARDLPLPDRRGAVPRLLTPADITAVEVVRPVVGPQRVRLAAVEAVELGIADAVGDPPDGLAEVGAVVLLI